MSAIRRCISAAVPGAAVLLTCALLFTPARAEAAVGRSSPPRDPDREGRLDRLHASIETAFQRCDSAILKSAFSPRVKTLLASRALGVRQGYYGADQVLLILWRSFEGRTTLRFKLDVPDGATQSDPRRVVSARWFYRDEGAAKSVTRLSFTLVLEGGVWYVREIREQK
jgi:hypothetical protein